jgi:hypothetical protein
MLFSYMLHFFAVISAISVLAAPLPEERKLFDFNEAHDDEKLSNEENKMLARGDWLRTAQPDEVWIISNQTCTHLTYCSLILLSNRWISLFSSLYVISCTCRAHQLEISSPLEISGRDSK